MAEIFFHILHSDLKEDLKILLGLKLKERSKKIFEREGIKEWMGENQGVVFVLQDNIFIDKNLLSGLIQILKLNNLPLFFKDKNKNAGIFLLKSESYNTIADEINQDKIINILKNQGKVIEKDLLIIEDKNSYRKAEKKLLNSLRKPVDGLISRYLNRPISLFISKYLVKTKITPNTITYFVFLLSLLSGILMGMSEFILGAILMQVSSILDGCDGEVARLKFQSSKFGAWLDSILDDFSNAIFVLGTGIGLYRITDSSLILILTILTPSIMLGGFFCIYRKMILKKINDAGELTKEIKKEDKGFLWKLILILEYTIKRDFYYFVFLIFAIAGFPQLILYFSFAGALGGSIFIFFSNL